MNNSIYHAGVADVRTETDTITGNTLTVDNDPSDPSSIPPVKSVVKEEITETLAVKEEPLERGKQVYRNGILC